MPLEAIGQRVTDLTGRMERLERTEPAVIASRLADITQDVGELRREVSTLKKLLISAMVTVTTAAVGSALTILITIGGKG